MLPQLDRCDVRDALVESVRAEVRRKSVGTPEGVLRPLAIAGKCRWSGHRGGGPDCQVQGAVRVQRGLRARLPSARPRLVLEQWTLAVEENEMGAFAAFWAQLLPTYGRLGLWEVITLDAGYCARQNATLVDGAGYGDVVGFPHQPELLREAQRLLEPLAAHQGPEAKVLDRDHGPWVRRSLWRTQECAGWLDWTHLRQVWLVRPEKFRRQTTPRADSVPAEVEDHDSLTNLPWKRRGGVRMLGVIRGHGGLEHNGFRTLDLEWQEERPWCTKGAATDVLGLLRLWAYNLVGLLKGRYLRAPRYRAFTVAGCVEWLAPVSGWGEARRRVRRVMPAR
jgi:hypothetical protein